MAAKKNIILELISLFIILIVSFLLWDTYIVYPIKLFVVLLHELSHVLSAIISGGTIVNFNIALNLSGKCEIEGGNNILIATAGYLGSLLFGLIIFYATHNKKSGKWVLLIISLLIAILSLSFINSFLIVIFSLLISILIFISAFFLHKNLISFTLKAFGILSCVYVLFDIKEDIINKTTIVSDANILSNLISVPVIIIGLVWILISFAGIIFMMRVSYFRKAK